MRIRKYYEARTGEEREEVLLSRTEQDAAYKECLQRVLDNPRSVLDSLESMPEFKVHWKNYGRPRLADGQTRS